MLKNPLTHVRGSETRSAERTLRGLWRWCEKGFTHQRTRYKSNPPPLKRWGTRGRGSDQAGEKSTTLPPLNPPLERGEASAPRITLDASRKERARDATPARSRTRYKSNPPPLKRWATQTYAAFGAGARRDSRTSVTRSITRSRYWSCGRQGWGKSCDFGPGAADTRPGDRVCP